MRQILTVTLAFVCSGALYAADLAERVVTNEAVVVRSAVLERTLGLTGVEARTEAVAQLRREELLLELAKQEGVDFSDAYVRDRVQDMRTMSETAGEAAFEEAATAWGIASVEEFVADPRVLSMYRRGLLVGEMRLRVVERLETSPTFDGASDESVDRYLSVALHGVSVRLPDVEVRAR
jgi:hypothetical protein